MEYAFYGLMLLVMWLTNGVLVSLATQMFFPHWSQRKILVVSVGTGLLLSMLTLSISVLVFIQITTAAVIGIF